MALNKKEYTVDTENDWALTVERDEIFIDKAESGRKGYLCIGCDKQMEAVKKKNPKHRSYFRHVSVDKAKDETPCTFSNREYREILATDILQRIKQIKVPAVYKYPPKGSKGYAYQLEKSKFVYAHRVKSQLTFYEDEYGNVHYGKNLEIKERYLLMRPDVVFFDVENKPILFIELVITHKIDDEKRMKLRRLGIDTVSVIVPRKSPQQIEDNFRTTKRIKWEYNGIEAKQEYFQISSRIRERILEFDEDQRRIFQESYKCRKARLGNTLRSIRKCIQSQPYKEIERKIESEISRVERNFRNAKQELERMENDRREEVYDDFKERFGDIKGEIIKEGEAANRIEREKGNLEKRYTKKRGEISALFQRIGNFEKFRTQIEDEIETIRGKEGQLEEDIIKELGGEFSEGNSNELPSRIRAILEAKRVVGVFEDAKRKEQRYTTARKLFNKGAWKAW